MQKIELTFINMHSFITITYIDDEDNKFVFYTEDRKNYEVNSILFNGKKYLYIPDYLSSKVDDIINYIKIFLSKF